MLYESIFNEHGINANWPGASCYWTSDSSQGPSLITDIFNEARASFEHPAKKTETKSQLLSLWVEKRALPWFQLSRQSESPDRGHHT